MARRLEHLTISRRCLSRPPGVRVSSTPIPPNSLGGKEPEDLILAAKAVAGRQESTINRAAVGSAQLNPHVAPPGHQGP